eukprot:TRINITY_DN2820_c0_g1_i1.p1 TRINITY_DN2820_c0_g1~~TRINITY_DN2820_c0_g1_i1.p1  ORF type:complete len:768 (+),score=243.71 TRINITY_DN2820_c0_g1_i1:93-2306(+)
MAETVHHTLEKLVPSLQYLEARRVISQSELREILKQRSDHEYLLTGPFDLRDARRVLAYEKGLEALCKRRCRRSVLPNKHEQHIQQRIKSLYVRCARRLRGDDLLALQQDHLAYITDDYKASRSKASNKEAGQLLRQMLADHAGRDEVWVAAAKWEMEHHGAIDNARAILQRALRLMPDSTRIWRAYFVIETMYWGELLQKLKDDTAARNLGRLKRKAAAERQAKRRKGEEGAAVPEDGGEAETLGDGSPAAEPEDIPDALASLLRGSIPAVVHRHAVRSVPAQAVALSIDMLEQCAKFPFTAALQRTIGARLEAVGVEGGRDAALARAAAASVEMRIAAARTQTAQQFAGRPIPGSEEEPPTPADPTAELAAAWDSLALRPERSAADTDAALWLCDLAVRLAYGLPQEAKLPESVEAVPEIRDPLAAAALDAAATLGGPEWLLSREAAPRVAGVLRRRGEHEAAAAALRRVCDAGLAGDDLGALWADWAAAAVAAGKPAPEAVAEAAARAGNFPSAAPLWVAAVQLAAARGCSDPGAGGPGDAGEEGGDSSSELDYDADAPPRAAPPPRRARARAAVRGEALDAACSRAVAAASSLGAAKYGAARDRALTQVAQCVLAVHPQSAAGLAAIPALPEAVALQLADIAVADEARARGAGQGAGARLLFERLLRPNARVLRGKWRHHNPSYSAALWGRWAQYEQRHAVSRAHAVRKLAERAGINAAELEAEAAAAALRYD